MLGSKDGSQGNHPQLDISNGHASLLCFLLGILHHDNELGDAICLNVVVLVVLGHVQAEGDHVNGMQPPTVGIELGHDFEGSDLCIESLGVLEVIVPNLVNNVAEELAMPCLAAW